MISNIKICNKSTAEEYCKKRVTYFRPPKKQNERHYVSYMIQFTSVQLHQIINYTTKFIYKKILELFPDYTPP